MCQCYSVQYVIWHTVCVSNFVDLLIDDGTEAFENMVTSDDDELEDAS